MQGRFRLNVLHKVGFHVFCPAFPPPAQKSLPVSAIFLEVCVDASPRGPRWKVKGTSTGAKLYTKEVTSPLVNCGLGACVSALQRMRRRSLLLFRVFGLVHEGRVSDPARDLFFVPQKSQLVPSS